MICPFRFSFVYLHFKYHEDKMKNNLCNISLSIIFILCCLASSATDSDFIGNVTMRDGLCGENIYKIYRDHRGMIWLGTSDGMNSFNGVTLHSYSAGNIKQNNVVYDIVETSDYRLFAATSSGLYQLKSDSLIKVSEEINGNVSALAADGKKLYVGSDKGLYVLTGDKVKRFLISSNALSGENKINDIFIDKQKRVWIASDKWLTMMSKGVIKNIDVGNKMQMLGNIHCLTSIGESVFMGSSNDGIIKYDIRSGQLSKYISVDCNIISELSTDGRDNLYVATDGNGAHVISVSKNRIIKSFTTNTTPFALKDNSVYSYLHDENGVDFFGSFRMGLMYTYYVNPIFKTYSYKDFTTENLNVRSFTINGKQKLIGTRNGFYFIDEAQDIIRYFSPQQIGGSIVISNVFYHGKYYICTFDGGVKVLDPQNMRVAPMSDNITLSKGSIFSAVVHNDKLWITTVDGLFCYDANIGKTVCYTARNSGLLNGFVNSISFDSNGNGWIGTQKGICVLNAGNRAIQSTGFPEGFFNNESEVYFTNGGDGEMIGFGHSGVYESKNDLSEFRTLTFDKNIIDESCAFIKRDNNARYWMATDKGLFYLDNSLKQYVQFGNMDNMRGSAFNTKAVYLDESNNVWIGCNNGLIYAQTRGIIKNHFKTHFPIIFGNVMINDGNVDMKAEDEINNSREIELKWNMTSSKLSFVPIILNYSNPSNTFFEYRIDGGEWYTSVGTSQIKYDSMLPGSHKLQIRLAGDENITEYNVYVNPSGMAYIEVLLIVFLILGCVLFVIRRKKIVEAIYQMTEGEDQHHKEKYSRVKIDDDECAAIVKKLERYLKSEKPYLDCDLKMSDLAVAIGSSANKLSQVFSLYLNQNYYDYINNYRLDEFKLMAADPEINKKYTIVAMSEKCGFKKTAFFNTFKRVMGITPTEYMQQINKNKE